MGGNDDISNKSLIPENRDGLMDMSISNSEHSDTDSFDSIPDNFFDDFSNTEFMAGLDILDGGDTKRGREDAQPSSKYLKQEVSGRCVENSPKTEEVIQRTGSLVRHVLDVISKDDDDFRERDTKFRADRSYSRQSSSSGSGRGERSPRYERRWSPLDKHNRRSPPRREYRPQSRDEDINRSVNSRERSPLRQASESSENQSVQEWQHGKLRSASMDYKPGNENWVMGPEREQMPSRTMLVASKQLAPCLQEEPPTSSGIKSILPVPLPVPPPKLSQILNLKTVTPSIIQNPSILMADHSLFDVSNIPLPWQMKLDSAGEMALNKPVFSATKSLPISPVETISDSSRCTGDLILINQEEAPSNLSKLFQDKKISLTDFLTASAKGETKPVDLTEKNEVIARCLNAMKLLGGTTKLSGGRFFFKRSEIIEKDVDRAICGNVNSPMRWKPPTRFRFTTQTKPAAVKTTMQNLLSSIGLSPSKSIAAPVKNVTMASIDQSSNGHGRTSTTPSLSPSDSYMQTKPPECKSCELRRARRFNDATTQTCVYEEVTPLSVDSSLNVQGQSTIGLSLTVKQQLQAACKCLLKVSSEKAEINPTMCQAQKGYMLTILPGTFLKINKCPKNQTINVADWQKTLIQLWFEKIHETLLVLLEKVMRFKVTINRNQDTAQLRWPKNNRVDIDDNVIERYEIQCTGQFCASRAREKYEKMVSREPNSTLLNHEIAITNRMFANYKEKTSDTEVINATFVVTSQSQPLGVILNMKNTSPNSNNNFHEVATFFKNHFRPWFESAIEELTVNILKQNITGS